MLHANRVPRRVKISALVLLSGSSARQRCLRRCNHCPGALPGPGRRTRRHVRTGVLRQSQPTRWWIGCTVCAACVLSLPPLPSPPLPPRAHMFSLFLFTDHMTARTLLHPFMLEIRGVALLWRCCVRRFAISILSAVHIDQAFAGAPPLRAAVGLSPSLHVHSHPPPLAPIHLPQAQKREPCVPGLERVPGRQERRDRGRRVPRPSPDRHHCHRRRQDAPLLQGRQGDGHQHHFWLLRARQRL